MLPAVEYLGHRISAQGLQPTQENIQAIHSAPAPTNVGQLKSYLGLLNYYCKSLPNLSSTLAPLYMDSFRTMQNGFGGQMNKKLSRVPKVYYSLIAF